MKSGTQQPVVAIVVAKAQNNVIGIDNQLPWRLPEDLRYFKRLTMGKPVIMGRHTYESIGKPLPGRTNIVLSRRKITAAQNLVVTDDLENALDIGRERVSQDISDAGMREIMVIGGSMIYEQCLPLVSRLYVTELHADFEGDAFFPEIDQSQWQEAGRETHSAGSHGTFAYSFITYERV